MFPESGYQSLNYDSDGLSKARLVNAFSVGRSVDGQSEANQLSQPRQWKQSQNPRRMALYRVISCALEQLDY